MIYLVYKVKGDDIMVKEVTVIVNFVGETNRDDWACNEYQVEILYNGREIKTPFYTGSGWNREPNVADVMEALFLDADAKNYETFESWAQDMGYDTDSRKAESIFNHCLETNRQLDYLLEDDREYFEEKYRDQ